jgi:hypothetical protein
MGVMKRLAQNLLLQLTLKLMHTTDLKCLGVSKLHLALLKII